MTSDEEKDLSEHKSNAPDQELKSKPFTDLSTITEVTDSGLLVSLLTSDVEVTGAELTDKISDKGKETNVEESTDEDVTLELPEFDWNDFEDKFTKALQQLDKEESQILDQFDQLMEMFFIWAQTGSSHETERAVKRLKTRERFVQLSEASLEKKKAHYVQVVSAFKIALDMLRN